MKCKILLSELMLLALIKTAQATLYSCHTINVKEQMSEIGSAEAVFTGNSTQTSMRKEI